MKTVIGLLILALALTACGTSPRPVDRYPANTTQTDTTPEDGTARQPAPLLSAFFGLDNGITRRQEYGLCENATGADGMPVVFDREVDVDTLQAGDFRVLTQAGQAGPVYCVTLFPAVDLGELRTALLIGEFGSATGDPPIRVEIVGNLFSLDQTINFKGAAVDVTPLPSGPALVLAESVPQAQWQLGKRTGPFRGAGSGCPQGTLQIVRAVWAGGVVRADGEEPGDSERLLYQVTLTQSDGSTKTVAPMALGDLGDGDNNHLLCLDLPGTPLAVAFPAGHLADPNHDLNPDTTIQVMPVR